MKKENLNIFYNCINLIYKESFQNFARISMAKKLFFALVLISFIVVSLSLTSDFKDYDSIFANSAVKLLLLSPFSITILAILISLNFTSYSSNLHEFFQSMNIETSYLNRIRTFILYITTIIIFSFIFFFQGFLQVFITFELVLSLTLVFIMYTVFNTTFVVLLVFMSILIKMINSVIKLKFLRKLYINILFIITYMFFYFNAITIWNNNLSKYEVYEFILSISFPIIISLIFLLLSTFLVFLCIYLLNVNIFSIYNITRKKYASYILITKFINKFNISKEMIYFLRNKQTLFFALFSVTLFISFFVRIEFYYVLQIIMFTVIFIASSYYNDIKEELNSYNVNYSEYDKIILAPLIFNFIVLVPHFLIINSIQDFQIKLGVYIFMLVGLNLGIVFPRNTSLLDEMNYQISQITLIIVLVVVYDRISASILGILIFLLILFACTFNYIISFKSKIRRTIG